MIASRASSNTIARENKTRNFRLLPRTPNELLRVLVEVRLVQQRNGYQQATGIIPLRNVPWAGERSKVGDQGKGNTPQQGAPLTRCTQKGETKNDPRNIFLVFSGYHCTTDGAHTSATMRVRSSHIPACM